MKKSVLLLAFLNKYNSAKNEHSEKIVYRHLSTLSLRQINALANKLNIDLNELFTDIFSMLTKSYFRNKNPIIISKVNQNKIIKSNYFINKNISLNNIKRKSKLLSAKQYSNFFEEIPLKFELKIVKRKILFTYFYTEDFIESKINSEIIFNYEKLVRKLIKDPYAPLK
jgi:hypothetical protein